MTNVYVFFARVTKQTAEIVQTPGAKAPKRPETIPEEPEPVSDPIQDKLPSTGPQRPASPQRPSSPQATTQRRPSTSPQRPYSPSSAQAEPVSFVGQRPGSEPQQRPTRPVSPVSNGSSESNMSPTLLEIPAVQLSEKVEQLTQDEVGFKLFNLARIIYIYFFGMEQLFLNVIHLSGCITITTQQQCTLDLKRFPSTNRSQIRLTDTKHLIDLVFLAM